MKKVLFILPFVVGVLSCSSNAESQEEREADSNPVTLNTEKDKLSYALGAMDAKKIFESNPNGTRLDQGMLQQWFQGWYFVRPKWRRHAKHK